MVARGKQGRVWRLDTDTGAFAIKELVIHQLPADAAYQEAVLAIGAVQMPRPIHTVSGEVLVDVARHQVRAYEWVDLLATDTGLDPGVVGATLAAVHQVHYGPARPLIAWYTQPLGALRWTQLLDDAMAADAPLAEALDGEITELLRLEALIEPPTNLQSCHTVIANDSVRAETPIV